MYAIAHLSDVHLPPLPPVTFSQLVGKRLIGLLSWRLRRAAIHRREIADAIVADIAAARPDHTILTGDMVNISTPAEFAQAGDWLTAFAAPDKLTFVPGNHDAYVAVDWQEGLSRFANYMSGDMRGGRPTGYAGLMCPFPFVRTRRNIALIGLSSAWPAPWRKASGRIGQTQLDDLAARLRDLRQRGFYRLVMVHHPPLPGLAKPRKALDDVRELASVLGQEGAELVIHGHNHMHMQSTIDTRHGTAHVIGIPSASAIAHKSKPAAAWYCYRIRREAGRWRTRVAVRAWNGDVGRFEKLTNFSLESAPT